MRQLKLLPAPDDPLVSGLHQRLVSENSLVEMGVYPVLYGWRVRAGFVGNHASEIDWCCGDRLNQIWSHYTAIYLFLRRRPEDRDCFEGLPRTSEIKPCWKDEEFEKKLTAAMLTIPEVTQTA